MASIPRQAGDTLMDTTTSIGKGVTKTIRKQSMSASTFLSEVKDCVDPEDLLHSITQLNKDEKDVNQRRDQKIIHTPIDWSKYPLETTQEDDQLHQTSKT